ncbi:hypothetical protein [Pseudarthrobacter sp. AB1]|uniref:hypothetical protein n=1 Tax=Pseudarthrobacter sp. AB1 TaxID=2138309 RepID=UPI00186B776C|nr:hypothetical protein [Pseudarthrobacter sp. AB1]
MNNFDILFNVTCLVVLAIVALIALLQVKFNMIVFLGYNLSLVYVGLCLLAVDGVTSWEVVNQYGLGVAGLLLGYLSCNRYAYSRRLTAHTSPTTVTFSDSSVMAVVLAAGTLGLYHLVASGIPIFSSAIEIERFDFTSSGLFGIPGRMFLFGIPIAWMCASVNAHFLGVAWREYRPWQLATGFYIVSALLSGFKSGMLAMLFTMLIVYFLIRPSPVPLGIFIRKYWWLSVPPVLYGLFVASSYSTYQNSAAPLWRQLLDRVTVVGAQPAQLALEGRPAWYMSNGIVNDVSYYFRKYTGGDVSFSYSFERAISAEIIGADPASSAWTTPVTIGGYSELVFSLGTGIAVVCLAAVGVWIAFAHNMTHRSSTSLLLSAVMAYGLYNWLLKGGLIYYILNLGAVCVLLSVVALFGKLGEQRPITGVEIISAHTEAEFRDVFINE